MQTFNPSAYIHHYHSLSSSSSIIISSSLYIANNQQFIQRIYDTPNIAVIMSIKFNVNVSVHQQVILMNLLNFELIDEL